MSPDAVWTGLGIGASTARAAMELMVSLLSMDRPPDKQVQLNPPLPLEASEADRRRSLCDGLTSPSDCLARSRGDSKHPSSRRIMPIFSEPALPAHLPSFRMMGKPEGIQHAWFVG
jgi:hypothetical protein